MLAGDSSDRVGHRPRRPAVGRKSIAVVLIAGAFGIMALLDFDGDGLSNWQEVFVYRTELHNSDTDVDGLTDYEEIVIYQTDPRNEDTDANGLSDKREVQLGLSPFSDSDGDGLSDEEEFRLGTSPHKADTDLDSLNDYVEVRELGSNPLALDIFVTCFVQDIDRHPGMLKVLEGAQYDLKNKVNFINLDGSRGINLHLPDSCENIPSDQYNFKGAYDRPISSTVLDDEALMRTSMGKYMKAIAEPEESRVSLQVIFANFEGSGFETVYGGFPASLNRQIVLSLDFGGAGRIGVNHEIGRLLGLHTSERPDSVMANSAGSSYYDDEWVDTLEKKNDRETLFRW